MKTWCWGLQEGGLFIGAAVTQEELIDQLLASCPEGKLDAAALAADAKAAQGGKGGGGLWRLLGLGGQQGKADRSSSDPAPVWAPLAAHLQRIAGNQVRERLD